MTHPTRRPRARSEPAPRDFVSASIEGSAPFFFAEPAPVLPAPQRDTSTPASFLSYLDEMALAGRDTARQQTAALVRRGHVTT